mgnify:CR=1 FL=1
MNTRRRTRRDSVRNFCSGFIRVMIRSVLCQVWQTSIQLIIIIREQLDMIHLKFNIHILHLYQVYTIYRLDSDLHHST